MQCSPDWANNPNFGGRSWSWTKTAWLSSQIWSLNRSYRKPILTTPVNEMVITNHIEVHIEGIREQLHWPFCPDFRFPVCSFRLLWYALQYGVVSWIRSSPVTELSLSIVWLHCDSVWGTPWLAVTSLPIYSPTILKDTLKVFVAYLQAATPTVLENSEYASIWCVFLELILG